MGADNWWRETVSSRKGGGINMSNCRRSAPPHDFLVEGSDQASHDTGEGWLFSKLQIIYYVTNISIL